jgi:5-methylcytosine-specific restriction protein A
MPNAALRYCAIPRCPTLVTRGRCEAHKLRERDRPNVDTRKWYRTPRWQALRQQKREEDPYCGDCAKEGRPYVLWTDLDHIVPHRGDETRFWDYANLQGLCASHHAAKTGKGG